MIEYEKIIVILHLLSLEFDYTMAKIGYILSVTNDDRLVTDKEWSHDGSAGVAFGSRMRPVLRLVHLLQRSDCN